MEETNKEDEQGTKVLKGERELTSVKDGEEADEDGALGKVTGKGGSVLTTPVQDMALLDDTNDDDKKTDGVEMVMMEGPIEVFIELLMEGMAVVVEDVVVVTVVVDEVDFITVQLESTAALEVPLDKALALLDKLDAVVLCICGSEGATVVVMEAEDKDMESEVAESATDAGIMTVERDKDVLMWEADTAEA